MVQDGFRQEGRVDFEKQFLVHVHIPKTGGSTLWRQVRERVGPDRFRRLAASKLADFRRNKIDEWAWDTRLFTRGLICAAMGRHRLAGADRMQALRAVDVFSGHFGLGQEPKIGRRPIYVGLIREPHDLFLSSYYYGHERSRRGNAKLNKRSIIHSAARGLPQSLAEYLDRLEGGTTLRWRNWQCRYLVRSARFEDAKAVIERNETIFAPLTEADAFGRRLSALLGVTVDMSKKLNVSQSRKAGNDRGEAERERIARHFEEDRKLYDYIRERWGR